MFDTRYPSETLTTGKLRDDAYELSPVDLSTRSPKEIDLWRSLAGIRDDAILEGVAFGWQRSAFIVFWQFNVWRSHASLAYHT
jgi:hypothetical protein